ncbi:hypothetical protein ASPACDRAFT_1852435 [Aspergillus aculeatus ATCC 16872]|uniref:Uncharacterized protein n=1 Tax=Aspergillus aculeatus (strain ATCC 16872 / CBS 172.66 / WB 5094) TaxID=690307 RepID=A0A1L9X549_ASPA1|nr:uncharacterized protein ASPACDRAFT_1852435 [Aspergillus aculeatus ATCC 16872]OJK03454.1 hypothetical protein ASPACDRAFT_1852435 [Aspergillus aculeatus ATCC 16872]
MRWKTNWAQLLGLGLLSATTVQAVNLSTSAQNLFDESMVIQDAIYDPAAAYLRYFYFPLAAGPHETRSSVWYAAGLLQRDRGEDRQEAVRILENVIGGQEKNVSVQWYGDYTKYPEQPTVGTPAYPPVIYNSWDPNWRGFIGTALIVIYEEFGHRLPSSVQELILDSLYNNTVGDTYRVGGVDGDNLYPAYSNAWLMRTVVGSWTGRKFGNANMTAAGDSDARAFLELFDRNGTLSEFNGPTYAGVSLYALTIAAKYLGTTNATIGQQAPRVIESIWGYESQLWNANLRNFAGPWDRSYGYDMNKYVAIMSLWVWSLLDKEHVFPNATSPIWTMAHADDSEIAPLVAILSEFHRALVPATARVRLQGFVEDEQRTYTGHAYAPPADLEPRNITTWLSRNLTIGTASFNQSVVGGFSEDSTSFSPAVVQWLRPDASVGYFNLYPEETALVADIAPYALNLTYPLGNASSTFTFVLASNPLGAKRDIAGFEDVDGLTIKVVGGTVDPVPEISFCGLLGGTCEVIHNFEFWNVTFSMAANSSAVPSVQLEFAF